MKIFARITLCALCSLFVAACAGDDDTDGPGGAGPSVVSTTPVGNATNVSRDVEVVVTFNRALDPASLKASTFYLDPDVSGAWSWDGPSLQASFRPSENLQARTIYTVTLTPGIKDAKGRAMAKEHSFKFTTGEGTDTPGGLTSARTWDGETATVSVRKNDDDDLRAYVLKTTASLRDNDPSSKQVSFEEQAGQMVLRSGNHLFDALFAMSIEEIRQNSVSSISDGAFNHGNGVDCNCFETGAKWNYVWTRDTAYAVDLGLAFADPTRSKNSLDFKLSERKGGGDLQVVQDTGTGGSYPVSTDRVVWAIGAWEVMKFLDGAERTAFRDRTFDALVNTIEQDRRMVFDAADGLYRGEQSFLDWREQSYPSWTAQDTVHIAMSKTLSTNVGHFAILQVAAALAEEKGDAAKAARYAGWAGELSGALKAQMWLANVGMYSAMKTTELDQAALHKYDLLGLSLAVLQGMTSEADARSIVSKYPHSVVGPPVLWPQQPLIPVYHNRGIWPFVTAYALLAAREVGNDAVFDHDLESLARGAALNLSNMENFEFLTLANWFEDGAYSGPVVNSRRQLWSVAGYTGAIVKGVFGLEATQQGVRFRPFVTRTLRNDWLAESEELTLVDLPYRGKRITVTIALPAAQEGATGGVFAVGSVKLNGAEVGDAFLSVAQLAEQNTLEITLVVGTTSAEAINIVEDDGDFRRFWAPREPNMHAVSEEGGRLRLSFDANEEEGVVFHVYRNGQHVAGPIGETSWSDAASADFASNTYCYALESEFTSAGNRSHHSAPRCFWGAESARVQEVTAFGFRQLGGGTWSTSHGRPHYENWGDADDGLEISHFQPAWTGRHYIQLVYGNGAGPISTGITAAVKQVSVRRASDGQEVANDSLVLPQLVDWERWGESTLMPVELDANELYRVTISDGVNMSYFAHFIPYTGGSGGGESSFNRANISAVRFLPMQGTARERQSGGLVALDGDGDLGKFDASQRLTPGAPYQEWDGFALDWDADYLYLALVSEAFEDNYKPWMIYIEATRESFDQPASALGMEYSGQTASLPFLANYAIATRQLSDDTAGPFNGIWRRDGAWTQQQRLVPGRQYFLASDNHTMSLRIPRAALGSPTHIRLAAHVVNAVLDNEWKDVVPTTHSPWQAGVEGFYEIELGARIGVDAWSVK
ncbi:MAG: Ig-like domain-containing protein [Bradymonadaceae bacterium]|nr:Ig-like domain-containing protein [Lujinxingiaceae bacterium]